MTGEGKPFLTKDALVRGFRALGLEAGMHVVVHSSLSRFGRVENGADDVIDGLEEVITPAGTVVMPTFTAQTWFFLEACALRARINGEGASGHGVVFDGPFIDFWREVIAAANETNLLRHSFKTPQALWDRVHVERPGADVFTITFAAEEYGESVPIRVERHAPPRAADKVKPNEMPVSTGIIPTTFWKRPETRRSEQYSGSFTAWGRLTDAILERHDNHSHQELEDHPLWRMKEAGGKILLLGVDHGRNSTVHVLQSVAIKRSGTTLLKPGEEYVGHFQNVDIPLDRAGGQTKGRIGDADIRLADTETLYGVVAGMLDDVLARKAEPSPTGT